MSIFKIIEVLSFSESNSIVNFTQVFHRFAAVYNIFPSPSITSNIDLIALVTFAALDVMCEDLQAL